MNTLYLVGNGFDCHHKLKTSYMDYRNMYSKDINKLLELLDVSDDFVEWSDFENEIGRITDEFIANSADVGNIKGLYELKLLLMNVMKINMFKWIKTVDKELRNVKKSDFILDDTDCFVTFNYTHVLEDVYNINESQILHIHGDCRKVDENIIEQIYKTCQHSHFTDYEVAVKHIEECIISNEIKLGTKDMGTNDLANAYESEDETLSQLLREVGWLICKEDEFETCIEKLIQFLNNKKIDEICILGNTYYGIDKYYYETFLYENFSNKRWMVYVFSDDDKQMYKKYIAKNVKNVISCKWPKYN